MNAQTKGWINGFIGVAIFSGSLPATRVGVLSLDPLFLSVSRASIAALFGGILLFLLKQPLPKRQDIPRLLWVVIGCIIGFPLLTALALQHITSAYSIVYLGLLPLCTAIFAVWLGNERPKRPFWLFACLGSLAVAGYAFFNGHHMNWQGDILMLMAVILCALGYAEGALLSKKLGGWQVMSWALVLAFPVMLFLSIYTLPTQLHTIPFSAWLALAYVSLFSMFLGFVFWYRGLAQGGIASVGQLQLLQPFMGFALAHFLLQEPLDLGMLLSTILAMVCVFFAKKYT